MRKEKLTLSAEKQQQQHVIAAVLNLKNNDISGILPNITSLPDPLSKLDFDCCSIDTFPFPFHLIL